jgi:hypothetical protein
VSSSAQTDAVADLIGREAESQIIDRLVVGLSMSVAQRRAL